MTIGSYKRQFTHLIRDAILFDNKIVVLLEIPFNDNTINNIYAVNRKCDILWQSEDISRVYKNQLLLPYEQMVVENGEIRASDFYGRRYYINGDNGKIIKRDIIK